jgi:formylglycine-generating enzyme required for sulfatase activity
MSSKLEARLRKLVVVTVLALTLDFGLSRGAEASHGTFIGTKARNEITVSGIRLCWCPAGRFTMGSPLDEPERRPDEAQVEVTLTKGFWIAKIETTQRQWKDVMGELPRPADRAVARRRRIARRQRQFCRSRGVLPEAQ